MELFASHCVFPTPDICKTAEYYHDKLGFRRVDYLNAKEKHICLYRDGVEFILTQSNGQRVWAFCAFLRSHQNSIRCIFSVVLVI